MNVAGMLLGKVFLHVSVLNMIWMYFVGVGF